MGGIRVEKRRSDQWSDGGGVPAVMVEEKRDPSDPGEAEKDRKREIDGERQSATDRRTEGDRDRQRFCM